MCGGIYEFLRLQRYERKFKNSHAQNGTQNRAQNGNCNGSDESFEQKFASYAQKSEEELTAQLLDVARRMKEQGSFDPNALENLYNTAYPMLGEMQRQRMRSIIDMLKG